MAIDPRIALGVQPVQQQPNMLAQYAQIMGIKAAQQEMEGNEGVRSTLSQGMPDDPATLLQYGKQGRATYESLLKGRKEKLESDDKRNVMLGGLAGPVMENPTPANFEFTLNRAVNYGLMTPEQREQTLAQYGGSPESIKAYASNIFKGSITAQAQQSDITSRRGQDITAGTTIRGQDITDRRLREQQEFERNKRSVIAGEGEFLQTDPYGNVYRVEGFGPMRGPNAPAPAMPPAAANAFVTTQPSVNALTPTAPPVVQPGSPTVANALALEQQQNIPRPRQPFSAPVPVIDKSGNTVLMQGREAVQTGATPATPATEARASAVRALPATISQAKDALNLINRMVGTPDGKSKPHKGFEGAVGAGMGMRFIPGTSARDFQAMHEQITGGAFMQAFETLKGGGQITEKEGEKATAAITRMSLATSEKEYMVAAREFQEVIRRGIQNAEKELRAGPGGGGAPADPLGIR
jgi:hypothetical protein